MAKARADQLLVARGLAESRAKAQAAIEAGGVMANGAPVAKPSQMLDADCALSLAPPHPWVSRGGVKLAHALDLFGVEAAGRSCLDVGASTGGFTDVLLTRGAQRVAAVDVGHGQLHPRLVADPRVRNLERTDSRALTAERIGFAPDLIVSDVSFIGLAKALPPALALAASRAELLALIKPQYERGPGGRGLLARAEAQAIAERVASELDGAAGFARAGLADSPILGSDGAPEFLYWARR